MNTRILNMVDAGIFDLGSASVRELDTDNSAQMRERMVFLLKLAVAISALIAVIGASLFSRNLNSRLQVVVKNAINLGQRKSLLEPIAGNDEIAELDRAVHEAATTIKTLEQSREDFMSMVSHDIRSPLNTIRNSGELIRPLFEGSDSRNERGKDLLSTIESNCDRILRLSQDLLDLQKFEAGMIKLELTKAELDEVCRSAIDTIGGDLRARTVTIETSLEPVSAKVDRGRIEQVLTNLISNAVKHSPRNGIVKIALSRDERLKCARISVSDNGKGIPEKAKKVIFNRFQQVDGADARRGTGLGLAICKALVDLHGGRIGVEDETPSGCRFWVELPLLMLLIFFSLTTPALALPTSNTEISETAASTAASEKTTFNPLTCKARRFTGHRSCFVCKRPRSKGYTA